MRKLELLWYIVPQVAQAHYCRLSNTVIQHSWPAYYYLLSTL